MGVWSQRWARRGISPGEADPTLLMWGVRRNINVGRLPERRVVVYFSYRDVVKGKSSWWLVLERPEPDLCLHDPGYGVDLTVRTEAATMAGVWMGDLDLAGAIRGRLILLDGPTHLTRAFPDWLGLNPLAGVERPHHDRSKIP